MSLPASSKKLVLAITGASGALYAQRLLDALAPQGHEVHVVFSDYSKQVAAMELEGGAYNIPAGFHVHGDKTMNVPFASGSAKFDGMVVMPCSSGTLGRIASAASDNTITRAADVFLKERRTLILVPREMPWNLLHARNAVTLIEAGAVILPASPSFYHNPRSITDLVDTVVARVLDHLSVQNPLAKRWMEESASHD